MYKCFSEVNLFLSVTMLCIQVNFREPNTGIYDVFLAYDFSHSYMFLHRVVGNQL